MESSAILKSIKTLCPNGDWHKQALTTEGHNALYLHIKSSGRIRLIRQTNKNLSAV